VLLNLYGSMPHAQNYPNLYTPVTFQVGIFTNTKHTQIVKALHKANVKIYYKNNYPNSNGNKTKITENIKVKAVSSL